MTDVAQEAAGTGERGAPNRTKLIEVALPLEAINVASARGKSIRHGHPSTLHLCGRGGRWRRAGRCCSRRRRRHRIRRNGEGSSNTHEELAIQENALMPDSATTLLELRERVATFVEARDWKQFHNPKDLTNGIAIEAAELMELFLWMDVSQVNEAARQSGIRSRVKEELADVLILCLSLANRMNIDVAEAIEAKLALNEAKYPAELARGRAEKYTAYTE